MLRAFLICYPEHLIGLHVSIVNFLNVRPYFLPILISDLYAWNVEFEDPSGYKQKNSFLIHCADRFSTIHLTHFLTGLNDMPYIKKSEKKILAAKLLGILWKRAPEIDFALIVPLTLEALGTMRHSHYGSDGSECESSKCEDYAPVFVAQHLVKILNHSSLDITPLLDYIAIDFGNKKSAYKQAGLRLFARLIRNATTHHASILRLLRTLVSGADNLTKCSLISMICRISDEAAELIQHVPLLLTCSQKEDEYEENLLATRATKAFQAVKDKLLILAGHSSENR
jgi:hypothetical protein